VYTQHQLTCNTRPYTLLLGWAELGWAVAGYIMCIRSARKNFFHLLVGVAFTPFMTAQFFTRFYYYDHHAPTFYLFIVADAVCVFAVFFF
jgi:hypothetical protein